ncbi:IS701 family transposase [Streptomyces scabiei]|uniref:IS701 family transposase n=2 Tax=Streptomyces scabiei TaxID=1930 RepID=UPI000A88C3AB|nr:MULTISPECIES: transposase [Streptomyces]MDX2691464.1 transposase [Streptomyces scabiei]MDX2754507.1 transposase [Streptomyces scabiei]MDX2808613.1 transposase [Streptomyces scabiei]MDX2835916.1 transposase [Streptomyces scabiei]MDX3125777.1 transposase [Streptomyces scabiei]
MVDLDVQQKEGAMEGVESDDRAQTWGDVADDFVTEFCRRMLASLKRRDQRTRGEWYVSGLLSVPGRKSMRALAAVTDHGAAEQSLHHFISDSSWAWAPVRQALARHLDRVLLPQAWVIGSMAIPKAGAHSVGVEESFRFDLGRVVNSQQAYGVSLANEQLSVPVNWGLNLPAEWLENAERRRRARIPDDAATMSVEAGAVHTAAELAESAWGLRRRPVVLDARTLDAPALLDEITRRGIPFVMRVDGATRVLGFDPGQPHTGKQLFQARQLVERGKKLSKPVCWVDPEYSITRSVLVSGTRVTVPIGGGPTRPALPDQALTLVGGWPMQKGGSPELWLSNLVDVPPAALLRLGRLTRRASKDFTEVSTRVGMRDFEGRSYAGWHRHVTLCSVAHAILVLSSARRQHTGVSHGLSA